MISKIQGEAQMGSVQQANEHFIWSVHGVAEQMIRKNMRCFAIDKVQDGVEFIFDDKKYLLHIGELVEISDELNLWFGTICGFTFNDVGSIYATVATNEKISSVLVAICTVDRGLYKILKNVDVC